MALPSRREPDSIEKDLQGQLTWGEPLSCQNGGGAQQTRSDLGTGGQTRHMTKNDAQYKRLE